MLLAFPGVKLMASGTVTLHSTRGWGEVELGGELRVLRFRAHEIALLEERVGVPLTQWFPNEETGEKGMLGMRWLREAILVGVAHEYTRRGARGRKRERLSPKVVADWIDDVDDFSALLAGIAELVALGLPGSAQLLADDDAEKPAEGEAAQDPLETSVDETRTDGPSTP